MLILNRSPFAQALAPRGFEQIWDHMFEDMPGLTASPMMPASSATPPMNVWEDGNAYFIEAELPGYRLEDLDITVLGDEVTIKGVRNAEAQSDTNSNAKYLRRERRTSAFSRTWTLPTELNVEGVSASLKDGVLLVSLPKSEKAQPRKITVTPAPAG